MFENRNLRSDLNALGLSVATVFLAVSLLTYDPSDPVREAARYLPVQASSARDVLVYPTNEHFTNACGRWGALAAHLTISACGCASLYLLLSLVVVDIALLRRRAIDAPLVRFSGWLATLVGITTLLSMLLPGLGPAPIVGSGGYLGAMGRSFVESHFAFLGGLIVTASLAAGGMLLCTDYWVVRGVVTMGKLLLFVAFYRKELSRRGVEDLDVVLEDSAAESGSAGNRTAGMSVKIKGKRRAGQGALDDFASASTNVGTVDRRDDQEHDDEELFEREDDEDQKPDDMALADDEEHDDEEVHEDHSADEPDLDVDEVPASKRASGAKVPTTARAPIATTGGSVKPGSSAPAPHFKIKRNAEGVDRDQVLAELDQASQGGPSSEYELPNLELLIPGEVLHHEAQEKEVRRKAKILEKTFLDFGFRVRVVEIETGPVIAQYEVELEAGLRLSKITGLADDLAIALRVPSVRIVAPIPGKNTVGIEVPNEERQVVRMREVIEESNGKVKKMRIPLFLGKDVSGNALTVDLATLPHLLIAGRTGTGKSVCLNAIISSILMTRRPDEVRMLMIDPKMVELSGYGRLPHLMHPVVTDMKKAEAILAWAVEKMEERYALLARAGVRHICSYNQLGEAELYERLQPETDEDRERIPLNLPFIVIVADEIADMMMQATGKEVEQHIIRLAQKSRAVGIHLILATQKPTVDVITGLIKSNLPARISFQVASRTDSRVVLDEMGADKLLGNGDMLFLWPGTSMLLRGQGTYLSDDEINRVVDFCSKGQQQNFVTELVNMKVETAGGEGGIEAIKKRDELYESAIDVVVREGRGSVSLLQRALGVGYGRAARLIDFMAEDGIVGQYAGSQAREVLISIDDWERMQSGQKPLGTPRVDEPVTPQRVAMRPQEAAAATTPPPSAVASTATAAPRRSNRIIPDHDPLDDSPPAKSKTGSTDRSSRKAARTIEFNSDDGLHEDEELDHDAAKKAVSERRHESLRDHEPLRDEEQIDEPSEFENDESEDNEFEDNVFADDGDQDHEANEGESDDDERGSSYRSESA